MSDNIDGVPKGSLIVTYEGRRVGYTLNGILHLDPGIGLTPDQRGMVMSMIEGDGLGVKFKDHNVRHIPATTTLNVEQALHHSLQGDLTDVIVVGYFKDSTLSVKSSRMSRAEALFMIEKAKDHIMGKT